MNMKHDITKIFNYIFSVFAVIWVAFHMNDFADAVAFLAVFYIIALFFVMTIQHYFEAYVYHTAKPYPYRNYHPELDWEKDMPKEIKDLESETKKAEQFANSYFEKKEKEDV